MPQSFASLHVHLVFGTKNRAPLINDQIASRLYQYVGGVVRSEKSVLVAAGGMPDHVHLLVSLNKTTATADIVRAVKANSSRWIHETFAEQRTFAWQTGYGAFAVSYSNVADVQGYIARQVEHHRQQTFEEEFLALLERHHIEFDKRSFLD